MTKTMFRYRDLVNDYRKILNQVKAGYYYPVLFKRDGKEYEILRLSLFDSEIDKVDTFLNVTSRNFKDNTAMYLNFVRYTLSKLIVTVHGKPKWVIEPKSGLVKYMLGQLNIATRKDLKNFIMNGHMTTLLGGNPVELRREVRLLGKKNKTAMSKISKMEGDRAQLEDKIGVLTRELDDLRKRYTNVCNPQVISG